MRAVRFGEASWLVVLDRVSPRADALAAARVARSIGRALPSAEIVAGGSSVAVHGVPEVDPSSLVDAAAATASASDDGVGAEHEIRVVYDGPDLDAIAQEAGATRSEIVSMHTSPTYTVEIVGFLPGFGYLAEVDERLRIPRLRNPRRVVARGSVGVAGRFTGVYPFASPGGWNLLGRAVDPHLFDPSLDPPARFRLGDSVRFRPVEPSAVDLERPIATTARTPTIASPNDDLEVVSCSPHATIQDLGRRALGRGVPRSGPLDAEAHRAANEAVGNDDEEATIEIPLDGLLARVLRPIVISVDGEPAVRLSAGDLLRVDRHARAVRYLAIQGGFDVPLVMGSRATLPVAEMGGLAGRRLRIGDRLRARAPRDRPLMWGARPDLRLEEVQAVEIVRGPHAERFSPDALEALCRQELTVSTASDRVGTRLDGARVVRHGSDAGAPEPMVAGAVQIATDGSPIVLGPDSAVTGGYPVIGVLTSRGRSQLARARPGSRVRLSLVE